MAGEQRAWRGSVASAALIVGVVALALLPAAAPALPGALDPGFGESGRVVTQTDPGAQSRRVSIAEGPNGTIVAAAGKTVFRYLPDGSLDPDFGDRGRLTIADPEGLPFTLNDLAVDPEGRVVLIGAVEVLDALVPTYYLGLPIHPPLAAVIRYTADGRPDPSFGGGTGFVVTDLGLPSFYGDPVPYDRGLTGFTAGTTDQAGDVIAIGTIAKIPCARGHAVLMMSSRLIVRLTPGGDLDPSFGGDGVQRIPGFEEILPPSLGRQGEVAVLGSHKHNCVKPRIYEVARLRADGSVDSDFGVNGLRTLPTSAGALALDPYGRTIVLFPNWGALRLSPEGTLDRRFGRNGRAQLRLPLEAELRSIVLESTQRILLVGDRPMPGHRPGSGAGIRSFTVVRLDQNGDLDRSFGHSGRVRTDFGAEASAFGQEAFVDREGRLVVGGPLISPSLAPNGGIALARYELGG